MVNAEASQSSHSTVTTPILPTAVDHTDSTDNLSLEIHKVAEAEGTTNTNNSPSKLSTPEPNQVHRNRIVVVGDDQGRSIQQTLQRLVGDRFLVTSFWKAGATLEDVLLAVNSSEIRSLKNKDFLIILGGCNDKSPFFIRSCLANWLSLEHNTNILISEVPCNDYLSEKKLNYELKFICLKLKNVRFVDMNYSFEVPLRRWFARHVCQNMLRELLNLSHKIEYDEYCKHIQKVELERYVSKGTQTDDVVATAPSDSAEVPSAINNQLFRS